MHIISGMVSIPLHWPAEHRAELPWDFYLPQVHYAVAWIAIGSIAIHVAVKIPVLWRVLRKRDERYREPESAPGLSWRGFSRTTWLASGVAVIATAGATVPSPPPGPGTDAGTGLVVSLAVMWGRRLL